jgi:hypothetical protein
MKLKKGGFLFYTIIVFIGLFLYMIERVESERVCYRISELERQKQSELDEQASLRITLSQLESPKYLDAMAKKMNFVVPGKEDIIYLQGNTK